MSFTTFKTQLFFAVLFFSFLSQVIGHSYVTSPTTRSNQAETQTGCRGGACLGPCEVPLSRKTRAPITTQRGDTITVKWPRNNHAGGFIRFAWAKTSLSDIHAEFDNHVQQINCHEVGGCRPDDASNPNGGDSGPADGSSRACTSVIKVPLDLTDGEWTLQWAWFGGAFALGDYYSCVDYKIAGGPVGTMTPVFVGGDYTYPNQNKCKFFNTDKLHICINEPCNTGTYPNSQQQSGVPAYSYLNLSQVVPSVPAPIPAPATTASKAPVMPATTAAAMPVTTAASLPSTTAAQIPVTTAAVRPTMPVTTAAVRPTMPVTTAAAVIIQPSTTGESASTVPSPIPTPVPTPVPTQPIDTPNPSNGCILGNQICVGSNQYQTCTNGREANYWAAPQTCQLGLSCHPSATENKIYCY